MEPYTKISEDAIKSILQDFDLPAMVGFKVLTGGSENTNYRISTAEGEYVLTLFERMSRKKTVALARLLLHLSSYQFSTTKIIRTNANKFITTHHGKPVLLKTYIQGDVPLVLSDDQLLTLGNKIGQLHKIPCPDYLPANITYGVDKFSQLYEMDMSHPFIPWLRAKEKYIKNHLEPSLTKSLIHADIFNNNLVISQGTNPIIIDFEEACYFFRIFDIGMAIVGACCPDGELSLTQARALLRGYQSINTLTTKEKEKIIPLATYAAVATAFWRFRQFHFIEPINNMMQHFEAMCDIAEQISQLENNALFG